VARRAFLCQPLFGVGPLSRLADPQSPLSGGEEPDVWANVGDCLLWP